jgi:hypothetical protein
MLTNTIKKDSETSSEFQLKNNKGLIIIHINLRIFALNKYDFLTGELI